jgi:hypothetical protein
VTNNYHGGTPGGGGGGYDAPVRGTQRRREYQDGYDDGYVDRERRSSYWYRYFGYAPPVYASSAYLGGPQDSVWDATGTTWVTPGCASASCANHEAKQQPDASAQGFQSQAQQGQGQAQASTVAVTALVVLCVLLACLLAALVVPKIVRRARR